MTDEFKFPAFLKQNQESYFFANENQWQYMRRVRRFLILIGDAEFSSIEQIVDKLGDPEDNAFIDLLGKVKKERP